VTHYDNAVKRQFTLCRTRNKVKKIAPQLSTSAHRRKVVIAFSLALK